MYYVKENEIETINFNLIAKDSKQDSEFVVQAFRLLRNQSFFKDIDKKDYIIWSDCVKHFRNKLMSGYLFKELKEQKIHG